MAGSPTKVNSLVDQASQLLEATLPEIDISEQLAKIRDDHPVDAIEKLIAFRKRYPDHPRVSELGNVVAEVGHKGWLKWASSEMEACSPDTAVFFEAWLPIASAWSIFGEQAEQREAMRRAREAIPRLTSPERVIEATIDLCQHDLFDRQFAEPLIKEAVQTCTEVSHRIDNRVYSAHLSGLSGLFGMRSLSAQLLEAVMEPDTEIRRISNRIRIYGDMLPIFECQSKVWTHPVATLDSIAQALERRRQYTRKPRIASCFAYAAIAAAKKNDDLQFSRMILKAESVISTENFRSEHVYGHARRIGEAYLAARQWQNAVIIGNNLTDPRMQASILFQVLEKSPQHVPAYNLEELFESYGHRRWSARGVAAYVEHRIRAGDDPFTVLQWVFDLPNPGLRGAAFAGVARAAESTRPTTNSSLPSLQADTQPQIENPRSLIELAANSVARIEDPIDAAYGWLEIARSWKITNRKHSYDQAVLSFHDCCFAAWCEIWKLRPSPIKSYKGTYYDDSSRRQREESADVMRIIDCARQLAEMQADFGDAQGALATSVKIANHAGFLDKPKSYVNWQYLFVRAIATRTQTETGVGPDVFLSRHFYNTPYSNAIIAAWTGNIPLLEAEIEKLRKKSAKGELARASAELAILYAQRDDIKGYRAARRAAFSDVRRGGAAYRMKSILATADAIAGEFALARDNIVSGDVAWFDGPSRPRSEISIGLANADKVEQSLAEAEKISEQSLFFRSRAFNAVAQARFRQRTESSDDLLAWAQTLRSPNDKIAALCGLALAAEAAQSH